MYQMLPLMLKLSKYGKNNGAKIQQINPASFARISEYLYSSSIEL